MLDKIKKAKAVIGDLFDQGHPFFVAWSGGKDSSVTLDLVLSVAVDHPSPSPIVITNANTLIENPEIHHHIQAELLKINNFSERHNLPVVVKVAKPSLNNQWAVKVIGGRAIPSFANSNRDCSVDFKINPQKRLRKQIFKQFKGQTPVTVIGTRFDESKDRKARMQDRKEDDKGIWVGKDGDFFLSPICYWSADDVWEYLGLRRESGQGYSDFNETFQIYADAGASSCAVVAEMAFGDDHSRSKGCGSRFGCSLCCVVTDKSMANLISGNFAQYGYMKGLNDLQKFLIATQYDFDRRDWFGRTIDSDGFITIRPDVYSPAMLEELLGYCLTLDILEMESSFKAGLDAPRFQLIGAETLIAIDAMWSMHGRHKPFHALYLYDQVYNNGARFDIPDVQFLTVSKKVPAPRYYQVGIAWEQEREAGLFNSTLALVDPEGACMGTKVLNNYRLVMDCETEDCFSVDSEAAWLILDKEMGELDSLLERYHSDDYVATYGYTLYASMGILQIAKGKHAVVDKILRRSNWKQRNGLGPGVSYKDVLAKSVVRNRKHSGPRQMCLPGMDLAA